ncbi:MAG: DNA repair protein RecO [Clostridia bacterium]|nr:DNA repair protein RecO [Clostridia bacterium]
MNERIYGLIIGEHICGDSDKRLTVLTPKGKIDVYANHARSYRSKFLNSTGIFTYGEFLLIRRGGFYNLTEISPAENFSALNKDLEKQALALFFADFAAHLTIYDQPDEIILRLMLNMLYALANSDKPIIQIKSAFELKAMSSEGYMPALGECSVCGKDPQNGAYLDIMNGNIKCPECHGDAALENTRADYEDIGTARIIKPLHPAVLSAMRYIISADPRKLLSFTLEDGLMHELDSVCESYMLNHIDHKFETFDFYKSLSKM